MVKENKQDTTFAPIMISANQRSLYVVHRSNNKYSINDDAHDDEVSGNIEVYVRTAIDLLHVVTPDHRLKDE